MQITETKQSNIFISPPKYSNTSYLNIILLTIFVIALINFFSFVTIAGYLGGDAVNGKIENGHFF